MKVISDAFPYPLIDFVKKNYFLLDDSSLMVPLYTKIKKGKFLKIVEDDSLKRQLIVKAYLIDYGGIAKTLTWILE